VKRQSMVQMYASPFMQLQLDAVQPEHISPVAQSSLELQNSVPSGGQTKSAHRSSDCKGGGGGGGGGGGLVVEALTTRLRPRKARAALP